VRQAVVPPEPTTEQNEVANPLEAKSTPISPKSAVQSNNVGCGSHWG
jgi:hypothetical protein